MSQFLMREETGKLVENAQRQIDIFLKFSHCKIIVDVGGMIDDHFACLPEDCSSEFSQVVFTHPVFNLIQQGLI